MFRKLYTTLGFLLWWSDDSDEYQTPSESGDVHQILNVASPDASITRVGHMILVCAATPGPLKIEFEIKNSIKSFVFHSTYLPFPGISIVGEKNLDRKMLSKVDVLKVGALTVSSPSNDEAELYQNAEIVEYILKVGETTYHVSGNSLSPEVRVAISNIISPTVVTIEKLVLLNKGARRTIDFLLTQKFIIS